MFIVELLIQPPKVILPGIYVLGGDAPPSGIFLFFFLNKDWGRSNVAGGEEDSCAEAAHRSFPSAGTNRRAAEPGGRGRGAARRGSSAHPGPARPPAP